MNKKQKALQTSTCSTIPFHVNEWDCDVMIREWNGAERSRMHVLFRDAEENPNLQEQLTARVLINSVSFDDGSAFEEQDIAEINKQSGSLLDRLFAQVLDVNRVGAKHIAEAKKN